MARIVSHQDAGELADLFLCLILAEVPDNKYTNVISQSDLNALVQLIEEDGEYLLRRQADAALSSQERLPVLFISVHACGSTSFAICSFILLVAMEWGSYRKQAVQYKRGAPRCADMLTSG